MKLISVAETAIKWGITESLVRRYCRNGKIATAMLTAQGWQIPEDTPKPGAVIKPENPPSKLVKKILYQRERNQHYGIYEYIQVNLAYSSCRMSSNRLTRKQVQEIYRTKRISPGFEPSKVDDVIEIMNHFICMRYVVDNITSPLTASVIKQIHYHLTYGTYADTQHALGVGEYRTSLMTNRISYSPPLEIGKKMDQLIKSYEKQPADLSAILDFHVKFLEIHPFNDYNARVARIIMLKECLRFGINPFIIDDKRRKFYLRGIKLWNTDPDVLIQVALEAQTRCMSDLETCQRMEYNRPPK